MASKIFRLPRVHMTKGNAGQISKYLFQPLLRHKHPHYSTKDFLEQLFDKDVSFEIRIGLKPFTFGGQIEDVPIGPPHPHAPVKARMGDVFTARFNPQLSFVHLELHSVIKGHHSRKPVYRLTPDQWEQVKRNTLNKEEFNMRKGQGHDTIWRNINKLKKLGFDSTTVAELTYINAGRIADEED